MTMHSDWLVGDIKGGETRLKSILIIDKEQTTCSTKSFLKSLLWKTWITLQQSVGSRITQKLNGGDYNCCLSAGMNAPNVDRYSRKDGACYDMSVKSMATRGMPVQPVGPSLADWLMFEDMVWPI